LKLVGFDVAGFTPAQLLTTRYLVDAMLPISLLIIVSLLTRPTDPQRVARFYVRMKTPVAKTLEQDAIEVERSYASPGRFDHVKLFPRSNWEFTKWDKTDAFGFICCCALVGVVPPGYHESGYPLGGRSASGLRSGWRLRSARRPAGKPRRGLRCWWSAGA
jgi:hypothetical protein